MDDSPRTRNDDLKSATNAQDDPHRGASGAIVRAVDGGRDDGPDVSGLPRVEVVNAINQRIFETSLDLILVVDRRGTIMRASPSSTAILGYTTEEMVGHGAAEFLYHEDLDPTRARMRQARRGESMRNFECRYVNKLGRIVTLWWMGVWSVPEEQYFFIGRDITDHKETERQLREARQMDALLREGIDGIPEGFAIYDDENRLVICNESYRQLFPETASVIVPGVRFETLLRQGLARGLFADTEGREEEWIAARLREHHTQEGAIEQQLSDGRWVLVSKHQMANGWTTGLRIDITALKTAQLALEDSERSFNYLFENSPLAMWVYEPASLRFLAVNHAALGTYGFSREEFLAMFLSDMTPPEHRERMVGVIAAATPYYLTQGWHHQTKDGRVLDVDVYSHAVNFAGKPARMVVTLDVTARKNAEARLAAENAERLRMEGEVLVFNHIAAYSRSLIEASLDPLVTISPEGTITDVNEATIKVTGVSRETLLGTDFSKYFTAPEEAREVYQEVFAKGFVTDYPLTIRHENGHFTDVLYNASVYRDAGGNVLGVFAAARDMTAQKRAEAEIAEQRGRDLERLAELEGFQRLTVGRELKMIELKKEILELQMRLTKGGGQ